jgi:hypothetical protein
LKAKEEWEGERDEEQKVEEKREPEDGSSSARKDNETRYQVIDTKRCSRQSVEEPTLLEGGEGREDTRQLWWLGISFRQIPAAFCRPPPCFTIWP